MNRIAIAFTIYSLSSLSHAASFPHTSAIFQTTMKGPMMEMTTDSYVYFDGNKSNAVSAEWVKQKNPMGSTNRLNITKDGVVLAVDLDRMSCTRTNIKSFTESISDPEKFAESIKKQMNLTKSGKCEGAGLKGVKYTSSFGELCLYKDVFMLWQSAMGTMTKVTKVEFDKKLPQDKITVPAGVDCIDGPDLSKGWRGMMPPGGGSSSSLSESSSDAAGSQQEQEYERENSSSSNNASGNRQDQTPPNMDEAMQKAKDVMKSLGDMFK